MFLPAPRGMRDSHMLDQRRKMLDLSRIAPLREWASQIAESTGHMVADFDPADGGVDSRVMILHPNLPYALSAMTNGPGMFSVDNDSDAAELLWEVRTEVGLHQGTAIHWTVVPWYVEDPKHVSRADIRDGSSYLLELLYLLPSLDTVVLSGEGAWSAWDEFIGPLVDKYTVIKTWDPWSVLSGPASRREELKEALGRAARRTF